MTSAAESEFEEDYFDDLIKIIPFEQNAVAAIRQQTEGVAGNNKFFDEVSSPEVHSFSVRDSDKVNFYGINGIECIPLKIKLVDCVKFPWYYKKNTEEIIKKITSRDYSVDDNDAVIDIDDSDDDDCIVITAGSSGMIASPINNDYCKMQPTRQKSIQHLEILKRKAEYEKTLRHKHESEIDFKRNVGLVGLTIKPKERNLLLGDENVRSHELKGRKESKTESYINAADKMLSECGTDFITILEDTTTVDLSAKSKQKLDHANITSGVLVKTSNSKVRETTKFNNEETDPKHISNATMPLDSNLANNPRISSPQDLPTKQKNKPNSSDISLKLAKEILLGILENEKNIFKTNIHKICIQHKIQPQIVSEHLPVSMPPENKFNAKIGDNEIVTKEKKHTKINKRLTKNNIYGDYMKIYGSINPSIPKAQDSFILKSNKYQTDSILKNKKDSKSNKIKAKSSKKLCLLRNNKEQVSEITVSKRNTDKMTKKKKINHKLVQNTAGSESTDQNKKTNQLHYYSLSYADKALKNDSKCNTDVIPDNNSKSSLAPKSSTYMLHNAAIKSRNKTVPNKSPTHNLSVNGNNINSNIAKPSTMEKLETNSNNFESHSNNSHSESYNRNVLPFNDPNNINNLSTGLSKGCVQNPSRTINTQYTDHQVPTVIINLKPDPCNNLRAINRNHKPYSTISSGFIPPKVVGPNVMSSNQTSPKMLLQNCIPPVYYQPNSFNGLTIRKELPSNRSYYLPMSRHNYTPACTNSIVTNEYSCTPVKSLNNTNATMHSSSYVNSFSPHNLLPHPLLPIPSLRLPLSYRSQRYSHQMESHNTLNTKNNCKMNNLSTPKTNTFRENLLHVDNNIKTEFINSGENSKTITVQPPSTEIPTPVTTKTEMLEELDKDITIEELDEDITIEETNWETMNKTQTNKHQKIEPCLKTHDSSIFPKQTIGKINQGTGYSPPILPIPSTIEKFLQRLVSNPPTDNVMVRIPISSDISDPKQFCKKVTSHANKPHKPKKDEAAKKISIEEYKKRKAGSVSLDGPSSKMSRREDLVSKIRASKKNKYRNHSVDSDLGYNSDTTVIV